MRDGAARRGGWKDNLPVMVMPAVFPPTALRDAVLYSLYFMFPAYQNTKNKRRATESGAPAMLEITDASN